MIELCGVHSKTFFYISLMLLSIEMCSIGTYRDKLYWWTCTWSRLLASAVHDFTIHRRSCFGNNSIFLSNSRPVSTVCYRHCFQSLCTSKKTCDLKQNLIGNKFNNVKDRFKVSYTLRPWRCLMDLETMTLILVEMEPNFSAYFSSITFKKRFNVI